MIQFKPISIECKELITSFTLPSTYRNCDFSFANMCSWQFFYKSEYAVVDNFLLLRFQIEDGRVVYMYPLGRGNEKGILNLLEEDALLHDHPFCLMGITPDIIKQLDDMYPFEFKYFPERDYFDYLYYRKDLVELKGKKYQSKRNHINRFRKDYEYEYLPITKDLVPLCIQLEDEWRRENGCVENDELWNERRSMIYALEHLDELGGTGGVIRVEGTVVAFTYGSPVTHDTYGVHVEKADIRLDGIYSVINQAFAASIPEQYVYINREEDLGVEGLRKAKLSYHPVALLEKNVAVKKRMPSNVKTEKCNIQPNKMLLDV